MSAQSGLQIKSCRLKQDIDVTIVVPDEAIRLKGFISSRNHKKRRPMFQLPHGLPDLGQTLENFMKTREAVEFISGALAGAMTKACLAPLETIRTRMVVGIGSKNIYGSFVQVIEQQGWRGLWTGNTINMFRIVPTQAIELATFEYVKRTMISAKEKWNQGESTKLQIGNLSLSFQLPWLSPIAVAGAAAGIAATLVCHPLEVLKIDSLTASTLSYPLEVARKRLMVGALLGKCPPNMAAALSEVVKEEGVIGLYRGWGASCMKVMPSSGITWMFYEAWKDLLLKRNKEIVV